MSIINPTSRTTAKRLRERAHYERDVVYDILDKGFLCHVGFVMDGTPYVIPTGYARIENTLYIHGSQASRMLRNLERGAEACVTVTHVDGFVMARSAFHHSMNYRSVVVLGIATLVEDKEKKLQAFRAFSDHLFPGRWDDVRPPTENELKMTSVLALPIEEASSKIRSGPPGDDEKDYNLPVWAGEIPLRLIDETPVNDPKLSAGIQVPDYLSKTIVNRAR